MNGAESLVATLAACGVEVCFGNPGTSEMHVLAALDRIDGIRPILALFEGVATGAADGYGRMMGKPAATLLHLGSGLGNGLANLHNARRAASPVVNIVGDHATYHLQYDAPLTSDISGIAERVSDWVRTTPDAYSVANDTADAVRAASTAPGRVATLIVPADSAWNASAGPAAPRPAAAAAYASEEAISLAARTLRYGGQTAILLRGAALQRRGLEAAGRIREKTGCRLLCDTFAPRTERGAGLVAVERIPYFAEDIVSFLADFQHLLLVGAKPPVAFFAYPDKPSWCLPKGCEIHTVAHEHEDGVTALEALADAIFAPVKPADFVPFKLPDAPTGKLHPLTIGQAIARALPEGAIVSDDSATSGWGTMQATATARPHTHLALTGGAIGQGLPLAVGAAVACPDRKVVCLVGDGSGLYTLQALWTQARESLDVTTVVFVNRSYRILKTELRRVGVAGTGDKVNAMLELRSPDIDWSGIARSMGVEACRVETIETFIQQFDAAIATRGPRLIEAAL